MSKTFYLGIPKLKTIFTSVVDVKTSEEEIFPLFQF